MPFLKSFGPAFVPFTGFGWHSVSTGLIARSYAGSARLADGRIILTGGQNGITNTFRHETEVISADGSSISVAASSTGDSLLPTLTRLGDNRILRAGGQAAGFTSSTTTETFDPTTLLWTTRTSMSAAAGQHQLTTLATGNALKTGGLNASGLAINTVVELFDQTGNTWSTKASMLAARFSHAAILMNNGKVLVVGGSDNIGTFAATTSVEIYDPTGNSWTSAASCPAAMLTPSAIVLDDGRVMVGLGVNDGGAPQPACYIYDPIGNSWTTTASLATPRMVVSEATSFGFLKMLDGKIVVAAGQTTGQVEVKVVEIYDPIGNTWTTDNPLALKRYAGCLYPTLTANVFLYIGGSYETVTPPFVGYRQNIERSS